MTIEMGIILYVILVGITLAFMVPQRIAFKRRYGVWPRIGYNKLAALRVIELFYEYKYRGRTDELWDTANDSLILFRKIYNKDAFEVLDTTFKKYMDSRF